MSSMRDAIAEKVDSITRRHRSWKRRRGGFLIRPITLILGWIVVLVGLITIPLPGPGWLTVFVGIGILSLELHWASRLLVWGIKQYDRISSWYRVQRRSVRYSLMTAIWAVVWIVVIGLVFMSWQSGWLPVLDPIMAKVTA